METDSLIATPEKHPLNMDYATQSKQRFSMFLVLCGALFFVAVVRLCFLATADLTDGIVADTQECKWQYNVIPAIRGRILDTNGTPLAWSERMLVLVYEKPDSPDSLLRIELTPSEIRIVFDLAWRTMPMPITGLPSRRE